MYSDEKVHAVQLPLGAHRKVVAEYVSANRMRIAKSQAVDKVWWPTSKGVACAFLFGIPMVKRAEED